MTLTPEQVQQLTATFEAQEHLFVNSNAYVNEFAVCTRLDNIDPSWELFRLEEKRTETRALVWVRLTVCGINREGVGMSPLTRRKKDGTSVDVDEPEKNAATDALRRAARLFGVGRYLLLLPKDDRGNPLVTNVNELQRWLDWYNSGKTPHNAPNPRAAQPQRQSAPETSQNAPNGQSEPFFDDKRILYGLAGKHFPKVPIQERANTINKMMEENAFNNMIESQVIEALRQRLQGHTEKRLK